MTGRPVNACESLHHKSLNFTGAKEDEALSHEWHVNYPTLPPPPVLYVATSHKHCRPAPISDILSLGLNPFSAAGGDMIDVQSTPPHHLGQDHSSCEWYSQSVCNIHHFSVEAGYSVKLVNLGVACHLLFLNLQTRSFLNIYSFF